MSTSSSSFSAAAALPPPLPTSPPAGPTSLALNLSSLGLGLAIVIALGFLALLSTILFASYVCCRAASRRRSLNPPDHLNLGPDNGVYLPRVIFVAQDDDDDDDENDPSQNAVVGLHPAAINSYPKFPYSKTGAGGGGGNDSVCSICLCEYRDGEMLRMLPDCRHFFHLTCLDPWLKLNASCPVCRNSPLPTPVSTPLSEVVPLSQYSDGRRR